MEPIQPKITKISLMKAGAGAGLIAGFALFSSVAGVLARIFVLEVIPLYLLITMGLLLLIYKFQIIILGNS